jgi:hypothetical protein
MLRTMKSADVNVSRELQAMPIPGRDFTPLSACKIFIFSSLRREGQCIPSCWLGPFVSTVYATGGGLTYRVSTSTLGQ